MDRSDALMQTRVVPPRAGRASLSARHDVTCLPREPTSGCKYDAAVLDLSMPVEQGWQNVSAVSASTRSIGLQCKVMNPNLLAAKMSSTGSTVVHDVDRLCTEHGLASLMLPADRSTCQFSQLHFTSASTQQSLVWVPTWAERRAACSVTHRSQCPALMWRQAAIHWRAMA